MIRLCNKCIIKLYNKCSTIHLAHKIKESTTKPHIKEKGVTHLSIVIVILTIIVTIMCFHSYLRTGF